MNERLLLLPFSVKDLLGREAKDLVCQMYVPFPVTIVGAFGIVDAISGTPTTTLIDFNDDGTEITGFGSIDIGATAGAGAQVKTPHLGGTVAVPTQIAAGSIISMDLKFTAGSTPKAEVSAGLWVLTGEG